MSERKGNSFAMVLQRMESESRTGILDVSGPDGDWEIHLQQGMVIDARSSMNDTWALGEALVSRGILDAERLAAVNSRAAKKGLFLEDIIVSEGGVSAEMLERIQTLQLRETLLPLFRKVGIYCHFRHEAPAYRTGARKIAISELLKEGQRRLQLWPVLERRIASVQSVYRREEGAIQFGFGELGTRTGENRGVEGLTPNQQLLLYELNGVRTVRQCAVAIGLGEFETLSALCGLLDYGLVRLVEVEGRGEKPLEYSTLPVIGNALATVLILALFAWVALSWDISIWENDPSVREVVDAQGVHDFRMGAVKWGLERSAVNAGFYPNLVSDLVREGWVSEEDARLEEEGLQWDYRPNRKREQYRLELNEMRYLQALPEGSGGLSGGKP